MDIINIITTKDNVVQDIESFAIVCPEEQDDVVEQAEKRFAEIVRKCRGEEIDDEDMEIYIEDNFSYNGIDIAIVWSNSLNE